MKLLKKISIIALSFVMIFSFSVNCFAMTEVYRYIIDNDETDPNDIGISAGWYGFTEIITTSYLYNGDARLHTTMNQDFFTYEHHWNFPAYTRSSGLKATLRVYLRNAQFTDPAAKYTLKTASTTHVLFGTINQDLATIGWNNLGTITVSNKATADRVWLYPSKTEVEGTTIKCGADAIEITLGY